MGVMIRSSPVVSAVPFPLSGRTPRTLSPSSVTSLQGLQMDFCPIGQSESILAPGDVSEIPCLSV